MFDRQIAFRLPRPGWPRAVFETDYGCRGGRLRVDGEVVAEASDRGALEHGIVAALADDARLHLHLVDDEPRLTLNGEPAPREDRLRAPATRSAWIHALLGLGASFAGFAASWLYLNKAGLIDSAWALKMGRHMAAWHLLLVFTLFPASMWGQRAGIRAVQFVCTVFFAIHVGIAIANVGSTESANDGWIGLLNAISGGLFLAAVAYGNRAWRDMDPVACLTRSGPPLARSGSEGGTYEQAI